MVAFTPDANEALKRVIYMLSQCKDAIDVLRCDLCAFAQVERLMRVMNDLTQVEKTELWQIFAPHQELGLVAS